MLSTKSNLKKYNKMQQTVEKNQTCGNFATLAILISDCGSDKGTGYIAMTEKLFVCCVSWCDMAARIMKLNSVFVIGLHSFPIQFSFSMLACTTVLSSCFLLFYFVGFNNRKVNKLFPYSSSCVCFQYSLTFFFSL